MEDYSVDPRLVAAGGAAALPFLGMIGEKELIYDPKLYPKSTPKMTLKQLERAARAGDIVITSKPGVGGFKALEYPFSGSEMYHSFPIVGQRKGRGIVQDVWSARFKDTPDMLRRADPLTKHIGKGEYSDLVLMRPEKKLSPEQIQRLQDTISRRSKGSYNTMRAIKSTVRDIFLPKTDTFFGGRSKVVCQGDVCSTLPARAYREAGVLRRVGGKAPIDVLPADYLREGSGFKPVGAVRGSKPLFSPATSRALRIGTRGVLGLGLGAGAYAAMGEPELTAGLAGAAVSPTIVRSIMKRLGQSPTGIQKSVPTLSPLLSEMAVPMGKSKAKMLDRWLGRTAPLALAGGTGAYLLAKKLRGE